MTRSGLTAPGGTGNMVPADIATDELVIIPMQQRVASLIIKALNVSA